ncbi:unnamed protein product [Allacma fusca]|uniref:protein-serine/threonine phosphatase n=1 Tax=Allacma fusca TaxID=39272 RepID=A0A8J2LIK5_9HEXA|nr:unnamed protein product [Allacma fusca]
MLGHGGGNVLGDPRVRMTRPTEFTFTFSHSAPEDKKLKEDLRKDTHYIFDNMSWRKIIDKDSTSVDDLRDIVSDRWSRPRNPFDEVFPGIFLGDASAALCMSILVREGIGFVVNAADSCSRCLAGRNCGTCVRTRQAFYNVGNIQLKAIAALDEVGFPLYWYFNEATEFIDNALATGGKVLVHCREGISRSATLVIAYLMMKKGMTAKEAVRLVRNKRQIYPNDGFLLQLCDLDLRLRGQRKY